MKRVFCLPMAVLLLFVFCPRALAGAAGDPAQEICGDMFSSLDGETRSLLAAFGLEEMELSSLSGLSLSGMLEGIFGAFRGGVGAVARLCLPALFLLLLLRVFHDLLPGGAASSRGAALGALTVVFALAAPAVETAKDAALSLTAAKNLTLACVPVLGGLLAFNGAPQAAIGVNGAVFVFAQTVSALFCGYLPLFAVAGAALGAAGAMYPEGPAAKLAALVYRLLSRAVAIVSGVFGAVLGVKGLLGGAADTLALKGVRLLAGGVPIVGGAVGDTLAGLSAGMGLIGHGAGALALLALAAAGLPALVRLALHKVALELFTVCAESLEQKSVASFSSSLSGMFSVLLAIQVFHTLVFAAALLVMMKLSAGA